MRLPVWLFVPLLFIASMASAESSLEDQDRNESETTQTAIFAGGCFWCVEKPFDDVTGVINTEVGYTGGHKKSPNYKQVSSGGTGHLEAVRVTFDSNKISYDDLLNIFWINVDPTDAGGQFCDRGSEYATAIFVNSDNQKALAENSLNRLQNSNVLEQDIVTPIRQAKTFYLAEKYHQDYYLKNPIRYKYYRYRCGRDNRLDELWSDIELPTLGNNSNTPK
jgi:peptide-methionine (S)-S-oxide reductase